MANKTQIKKFLEKKQQDAINKLKEESTRLQEKAKDNFFEAYKDKFADIKSKIISTSTEYDNLANGIKDLGIATFKNRYSSPVYAFNELLDKLSITNLRNYYIEVVEAEKIKAKYEKKIEDCNLEYNNLIALCSANNAKDGIKILEGLGFDTSGIEVKQESTALITNIDAKKLFI